MERFIEAHFLRSVRAISSSRRQFNGFHSVKGPRMTLAPGQLCRFLRVLGMAITLLAAHAAPAAAETLIVAAGGDLQAAINLAQPGDTILVQSGATFTGKFTLPPKNNPQGRYITIRSSAADTTLPPAGTRITPAYAGALAKIQSSDGLMGLHVLPGASYYRVQLLEFLANVGGTGDIVRVGTHTETDPRMQPHHITFDRVYIHGDPVVGQKNGLVAHAREFELIDSYITDIMIVGAEAHAFMSYNGPGPYHIENNHLEASSVNLMFGGSDSTNGAMIPSDITIRRNLFTKKLAWMSPRPDGKYWNVKNLFELKVGINVLVEGNVFEHNWYGAGDQLGYAILMRSENQGGACDWCETGNVTFQHNRIRKTPAGFSMIGLDYPAGGTPRGVRMHDVVLRNNVFEVDTAAWYVKTTPSSARFSQVNGVDRLTLDHNTFVMGAQNGVMSFTGSADSPGFTYTNNMSPHRTYGFKGDGTTIGTASLNAYTVNYLFAGNVIAGGSATLYPSGNYFPTEDQWKTHFVDYAGGNFRLGDSSAYNNAGTDGKDLGADIDALEAASAPNPRPTAHPQSVTTPEDASVAIVLTGSDPAGEPLTYSVIGGAGNGTLSGTAPNVTYSPNADFSGTDYFAFTVRDPKGGFSTATVTITVTPANDPPTAQPQSVTTQRDIAVGVTLTALDPDGDTLAYAVSASPAHGSLSGTAPNLVYTPAAGFTGADSFTFRATDPSGETSTATVSITVTRTNAAPLANSQTVNATEDTPAPIVLTASDPDNEPLVYAIVTGPASGVLTGIAPNLTYTPSANYNGPDSFVFSATDTLGASSTATVSIGVVPVNDAPAAAPQRVGVRYETAAAIVLTAADVEGDALTYAVTSAPARGTLTGVAPQLTYTPAAGFSGTDSFTFSAADPAGASTSAVVSITVAPPNTWLVFEGGDLQAAIEAAVPGDVIRLQAGATFTGKYTLPAKANPDGRYITIQTDSSGANLPGPGIRITPDAAPYLAKIRSSDELMGLHVLPGASYWRVQWLEFLANVNGAGDIIRVGSHLETNPASQPHHIVFDRVFVHGDPVIGQKNGMTAHGVNVEVKNSYFTDIMLSGAESHAFVSYNGPGPYLLDNNLFEAAGINILFGGVDPLNAQMLPRNITVRGNHITKKTAWMQPRPNGTYWQVKNLFELKLGVDVLIEGNLFEHNWVGTGDQQGYAILMRTENQGGGCDWCETGFVTFRNNRVRRTPAGLSLIGLDYPTGGSPRGIRMHDVVITNNLFDEIDVDTWFVGVNKAAAKFSLAQGVLRLTMDHNTIIMGGQTGVVYFGGSDKSEYFTYTNNMSAHKTYGFKGDGTTIGNVTLNTYTTNYQVLANVLAGGNASLYPSGNHFPTETDWQAHFVDYAAGNFRLRDTSAYKGAGTDAKDLGANLDAVERALAAPPPNLAPVADGKAVTTDEETSVTVTLTATDPEGTALSYRIATGPVRGTLQTGSSADGSRVTYTPQAAFTGSDQFTFVAVDAGGVESAPATVTVTIAAAPGVVIAAGGDLQAAIDAAVPGDVIRLAAGATFIGNYRLPAKPNPEKRFITIRSEGSATVLPSAGTRITPVAAPGLAKLQSGNGEPALEALQGASYYRLRLLEFGPNVNGAAEIIRIGSAAETVAANQPHHIVFDRVYVHGDAVVGQKHGIVAHGSNIELLDSRISDIKKSGDDSRAFMAYNGAGPYRIENNFLEAAGSNVVFGGADPKNAGLVPSNITIRRNHVTKNTAWMQPRPDGTYWTVKSLLELRLGRTVTVEENLIEHTWSGASEQPGYAILLRTETTSGACDWCETANVIFRTNRVRRAPAGLSLIGLQYPSTTGPRGVRMHDVTISNNLFDEIDVNVWFVASIKSTARFALVNGVDRLTFDHNTMILPGQFGVVNFTGTYDSTNFTYTNNMSAHLKYGFKGDGTAIGTATLNAYTAGRTFGANVLAGGKTAHYPTGNFFPSEGAWRTHFVNYSGGNYRLVESSVYRGAGTDGADLGANIDQVDAAAALAAPQP